MFGMGKTKYWGLRGSQLSIAIGVIAGLDFLLFGYDQGVTGGLLEFESFRRHFPEIDPYQWRCEDQTFYCPAENPNANQVQYQKYSTYQGIAVAAYNLGCFLGAVATIWIGNWLGRKKTIFWGSVIMTIGALLQCTAYQTPQFILARIVTGIGNGLNTSTVPTWQSETSKSHRRGPLVMIEGSLITLGIMISYWIDFGTSFVSESEFAWRFPIAFQIFFAIIIFICITDLPESPRWLVLKGRDDEALEILELLHDLPRDDVYIQSEFLAVKDTVAEMSKGSFADLFKMGELRNFHRVVLAYVNQMFQQISGINLITYYAPVIYGTIGLQGHLPSLLAACNGTEYFLASLLPIFTIEKVGRRLYMLIGAAGMSLSMVALTVANYYAEGHADITIAADGSQILNRNSQAGVAAAVFLFVFNTFFAFGWLGMTWLYPAEIVPLRIRAPANALSTSANWIFNFMVVMITPVAFANIQYRTYIIFAVINAFIFPVVYFFFPETRYRSLEEMDAIFAKSGILSVVPIANKEPHRFDKQGNLLIAYQDTEGVGARRRSSLISQNGSRKNSLRAQQPPTNEKPATETSDASS